MSDISRTAFEKRVKRRIVGKPHSFYAVVAPGLEELCVDELKALSAEIDIRSPEARSPESRSIDIKSVENGGIEFEASLADVYAANLHLRTATRILMRVDEFDAQSFSKFEKEFFNIPWELYLPSGCRPEVSVKCSKCRIYHSDALADRITVWFADILGPMDETKKKQHIFVRGSNDKFVISLNTSGEPLYKRGLKEGSGMAPIRETLAAGVLSMAGYVEGMTLVDPMCGTGTFSIEAAMISKRIPAGYFRDFAFTDWPSFMDRRWEHMRSRAGEGIISADKKIIYASDLDSRSLDLFKRNIEKSDLYDIVLPVQMDFFEISGKNFSGEKGLIVLNPPYGKRLGNIYQGKQFFIDICQKLKLDFKGWKLAIIAPGDFFSVRLPFKEMRLHDVFHGGLKLKVLIANI